MKCPMCGGDGITDKFTPNVGRCIKCNGSGEIEPTNEEWLHSLNTEQLAERIISLCVTYFDRTDLSIVGAVKESLKINDHYDGHIQKDLLVEWLKQPHTVKE